MGFLDKILGNRKIDNETTQEEYTQPVCIKKIVDGEVFEKRLCLSVVKQPYNGEAISVNLGQKTSAILRRTDRNGAIEVIFSDLNLLKSKNIIQSNLSLIPEFNYRKDYEGDEFASAEINNSFVVMSSGKEYISLFQVTKQKGELISFLINNLPNVGDYYYLLILREKETIDEQKSEKEEQIEERENPARPTGLKITRSDMKIEYKAYEKCLDYPTKMRAAKKSGCLTPPFSFNDMSYRSLLCKDDCIFCHCPFYDLKLFMELRHNHREDYDEWVMTYFKDFK